MTKTFLLFFTRVLNSFSCCTENTNALNGRGNAMFSIDVWILSDILTY